MPDPGEPSADVDERDRRGAGTVPGSPDEPGTVHLITWLAPLASEGNGRWSTACPADVADLPAGASVPRIVHPVDRPIDCLGCMIAEPVRSAEVTEKTAVECRRRDAAAGTVAAFLRWARDERGLVIADYAGGVTLKAYPSAFDAQFIKEWVEKSGHFD